MSIAALLIEDDVRLARFLADYFVDHDVSTTLAHDGKLGLEQALRGHFDVVVLDVMLPGRDGVEVCRSIRQHSDVPIVMVTARDEEADRILGLESGADDYVLKPFSPRELLARIRAVVRRTRGELGPRERELRVGELAVHLGSRQVTVGARAVELTTAEFELLTALARRPGHVLSREQLLELAKGNPEQVFERAVDVQISRLRHKLAALPGGEGLIRTVRGVGYMLAVAT